MNETENKTLHEVLTTLDELHTKLTILADAIEGCEIIEWDSIESGIAAGTRYVLTDGQHRLAVEMAAEVLEIRNALSSMVEAPALA